MFRAANSLRPIGSRAVRLQSTARSLSTCVNTVDGVQILDAEAWWRSVHPLPTKGKLRGLLEAGGVEFWDDEHNFVKTPVVALSAVGGIPLRAGETEGTVKLSIGSGVEVPLKDLIGSLKTQMGLAAFPSYLNPKNTEADEMYDIVCKHRHFSVGHAGMLSFVMMGHSCAVENEFNSQRDVVHMGRLTVARTAAQRDPPIVVQHESLLPLYTSLRASVAEGIAASKRPENVAVGEWQEALYQSFPSAKAHIAVISGSIRNLQKLVGDMNATGKEAEFCTALYKMNDSLNGMLPDMFPPSSSYNYKLPPHIS